MLYHAVAVSDVTTMASNTTTDVSANLHMTVSELKPTINATVHGVLVGISPMKDSKQKPDVKYFDGRISDGNTDARVVSFTSAKVPQSSTLHHQFVKAHQEKTSIALTGCTIKPCKWNTEELEIVTNYKTEMQPSPKRFKINQDSSEPTGNGITPIAEAYNVRVGQTVTVKGKVVKMIEAETVYSKGKEKILKKQEIMIAEKDSSIRGVLWESQVDVLTLEKTYIFKNARVLQYNDSKYLSFPDNSFEPTDDVEVLDFEEEMTEFSMSQPTIVVAEIVEVNRVEKYISCRNCSSKVNKKTEHTGECSKCKSRMKLSRCPMSLTARFVIENEGGSTIHLTAFGDIVQEMTQDIEGEDMEEKLLNTPKSIV